VQREQFPRTKRRIPVEHENTAAKYIIAIKNKGDRNMPSQHTNTSENKNHPNPHQPSEPQNQSVFERIAQRLVMGKPNAVAHIKGSFKHPGIRGKVEFRKADKGTLVSARVYGLPTQKNGDSVFAFHIHSGESCAGTIAEPFSASGGHYNPGNTEHPYHAGDMPELFAQNGFALSNFYTERFTPRQVIGRTVIIHEHSENDKRGFGEKIACGVIVK
jgi:Cu-Zn family superoxide dismutase